MFTFVGYVVVVGFALVGAWTVYQLVGRVTLNNLVYNAHQLTAEVDY